MIQSNKSSIDSNLSFEEILPHFNPNHPILTRAVSAKKCLEDYSRYALAFANIPDTVIPQFSKLKAALSNIQKTTQADRQEIISLYPELKAHIELLDHCLKHYPDVLQGKMHYIEVLFPEGNIDSSEETYLNPEGDYINAAISDIVHNYVANVPRDARILEVNGGMGTCTRHILPKIRELECEYVFTDVGTAFVRRAQRIFKNFLNIKYSTYNVEKAPPSELGIFDIVIGVNVLHATSDILITLKNMRQLVKKGGVLVLHEVTERSDYATLTAGLTSGWWAYEDAYRIADSPLISPENWLILLKTIAQESIHPVKNGGFSCH